VRFSFGLLLALTMLTGCISLPPQTQVEWETFADDQKEWPTSNAGLLHIVEGFPVYGLGQVPPQPYQVLGIVHVTTVSAPGQSGAFDERTVTELARQKEGQAALLMKRPVAAALQPRLQQTDYLVVKFNKNSRAIVLELINYFLDWSAANTNGYLGPDGRQVTAAELAAHRAELETARKALQSAAP
jgi:hypothetical protein